jgi:hypothetical protein
VLITAEAHVNPAIELLPSGRINPTLHRMEPTRGRAFKVHSRDFDPDTRINLVHVKVVLTMGLP